MSTTGGKRGVVDQLLGVLSPRRGPEPAPSATPAARGGAPGAVRALPGPEEAPLLAERLDSALGASGLALFDVDREMRYVWTRQPAGAGAEQPRLGRTPAELWPPAEAQRLMAAWRRVLHTGAGMRAEFALGSPGGLRHVEQTIEPLRDRAGLVTGLRIAERDVTERREARERSRNDQELFRVAQDQSLDAFEVLRPLVVEGRTVDFVWEYLNPAAASLLGRPAEQLVGQRLLADPRDRFQIDRFEHWVAVLARGEPMRASFEQPAREGGEAPPRVLETLSLSLGDRLAATTRDVSVQRRLLEAERAARESLQRATRMRDRFLANLSHELRTPLNAIVGWAHLLGKAGADPALMPKAAEAISRNARIQAVLVDDLVDMNRIVSGTLSLSRQRVDLSATLLHALESVSAAARARWLRIDTSGVAPGVVVHGDPDRLEQVFWHVLTNAVKFTPLNGAVDVRLSADETRAHVVVRDTGEGIAPELLPHLFDGPHAGDEDTPVRRPAGLGLGLAIVRSLVELHEGEVRVHSAGTARGTTVQIDLPLAHAASPTLEPSGAPVPEAIAAAQAEDTSAATAGASASSPLAWRRILIVDDDADSLELMTMLLRNEGAIVRAFDRAEDALAAAENGTFDLIVSDLGMPGMDGLELMRRINQRPLPIKAVALTAYTGETERNEAIAAGFSRVETKPISPPQFLQVVLAEVGRAQV